MEVHLHTSTSVRLVFLQPIDCEAKDLEEEIAAIWSLRPPRFDTLATFTPLGGGKPPR